MSSIRKTTRKIAANNMRSTWRGDKSEFEVILDEVLIFENLTNGET